MKRKELLVGVVAVLLAWWLGAAAPNSISAGAAASLATPSDVKVTPTVGGITVSWTSAGGAAVTFTVTSSPPGKSCVALNQNSCAIDDTSSIPYSFTVVASQPGATSSAKSLPTTPLAPRLVLVVAGQSNANGYESYAVDPGTGVDYMAPPFTNGADSHDMITWLPWSQLQGIGATPVPLDSPQQIGSPGSATTIFGPELGLARQVWTDTGRAVTIVKAADNSTSLAINWSPVKKGTAPNGLFTSMVNYVRTVMANDAAKGQFDVLGGVYWYQGESDVTKGGWAAKYQTHLQAFISALRAQLPMSPTAPIVLAAQDLSRYLAYLNVSYPLKPPKYAAYLSGNSEVRAADTWAAAHLPSVYYVETADLDRVAPYVIHLSNVAPLALGARMAGASDLRFP